MKKESNYIFLWKEGDLKNNPFSSDPLTEDEKEKAIVLIELLTNDTIGGMSDQAENFVDNDLDDIMEKYNATDYQFLRMYLRLGNITLDDIEKYKKEKIYVLVDGRK